MSCLVPQCTEPCRRGRSRQPRNALSHTAGGQADRQLNGVPDLESNNYNSTSEIRPPKPSSLRLKNTHKNARKCSCSDVSLRPPTHPPTHPPTRPSGRPSPSNTSRRAKNHAQQSEASPSERGSSSHQRQLSFSSFVSRSSFPARLYGNSF